MTNDGDPPGPGAAKDDPYDPVSVTVNEWKYKGRPGRGSRWVATHPRAAAWIYAIGMVGVASVGLLIPVVRDERWTWLVVWAAVAVVFALVFRRMFSRQVGMTQAAVDRWDREHRDSTGPG